MSTLTAEPRTTGARWMHVLTLVITFGLLFALAYWGGAARIDALFFVGVVALSGILVAFAALTWWLYLSPLPQPEAGRMGLAFKPVVRQVVGLLAVISGLLFITGGVWDETWHKLYGVGGPVNDFFLAAA